MDQGQKGSVDCAKMQQTHFDPYQQQLDKVSQDLESRETRPQLVVISGLPGIGKASFASELARRLPRIKSTTPIKIHIPKGASHQDLVQYITSKVLEVENPNDTVSYCLREEFLEKLEQSSVERVILIFGITNAVEEEQPKILSVVESLVSLPNCTVLMTSGKYCVFSRLGPKFYPYVLQPPSEEVTRKYLESFAPHLPLENYLEPSAPVLPFRIGDILKKCGQHPKLVTQVGDMLKDKVPVSTIWDSVKKDPLSILPKAEAEAGAAKFGDVAFQRVTTRADRKALKALAEVDGPFDEETFCAITGKDASQCGLAVRSIRPFLSNHLLAKTDTGTGRSFCMNELMKYTLHQKWGCLDGLVQSRNRFCLFYAQLLQRMTPLMHSYQPDNLPLFQADFVNLQKLLEMATFATSEDFMYELIVDIAHNSQEIIYDFLQKKEVVPFYESCVRAARQRSDERRLAYVLIALSHAVLMFNNNFGQVEGYLSDAQELLEKIGETDTLNTVRLHMEKGWYLYKCAKHQEAMSSYEEARRILLDIITGEEGNGGLQNPMYLLDKAKSMDKGGLHLWVLSSINSNIATIYTCMGNFESSISDFKQNLKLQNALWTERHPHSALTNHKLGLTYLLSKDFKNALKYGTKGLNLRMFLTKGASHTTIQSLSMVAMAILDHNGNWQHSLRLLQEAIEMREELGPTHPDMGLLHHSMGNVYRFCRDHKVAQKHYQQAVEIRLAAYGLGPNFCTVESLDALTDMCLELGEAEGALKVQEKCLKMLLQHLLESAEGHVVEDEHGVDLVRTTCKKISLTCEAMHDESQAEVWQNASESERPLSVIPHEYFPP